MISEEQEALIVPYLLEELSTAETREFEENLARLPELASLVEETREALAVNALASCPAAEISAGVRSRILQAATQEPSDEPATVPFPKNRSIWPIAIPWGIAAALALVSVSLWQQRGAQNDTIAQTQERLEASSERESQLLTTIETLREQASLDQLQLAGLKSQVEDQPYFGFVVWKQEEGEGVLRVYNLPKLNPEEKDYQLWVVDPQYGNPVDAGVFQVNDDGTAEVRFTTDQPVETAAAFAVSLEKQGGVPVAEGPMMVVGS